MPTGYSWLANGGAMPKAISIAEGRAMPQAKAMGGLGAASACYGLLVLGQRHHNAKALGGR